MRKMKKTTTPKQFEIIVSYLKHHEDLFVGCSNSTQIKARRKELWIQLTDILNHNGPPVRKCNEWKIIWSDYKYNLKRKRVADLKLRRKNYKKSLPFNETERTVLAMLGLRDDEIDYNINGGNVDEEESLPEDVPHPLAYLLPRKVATGSDAEIVVGNTDQKESIVLSNDDFTKEEPVIQPVEPLAIDEEMLVTAENKGTVPPTLSDALMAMDKTQQAILKELKESNRQKKQMLSVKERLLTLEQEKFDEKKLQNYEENKRAYTMIELRRKELELYELKLKRLCTQCTQVKTEAQS